MDFQKRLKIDKISCTTNTNGKYRGMYMNVFLIKLSILFIFHETIVFGDVNLKIFPIQNKYMYEKISFFVVSQMSESINQRPSKSEIWSCLLKYANV